MARQSSLVPKKKRRGPAPTGKGAQIQVRLHPPMLAAIDDWRARLQKRNEGEVSRPDAIRSLIEVALVEITRRQIVK
jgi:hypothetical protein